MVQIDDDEDVARVSPEKDELLEAEAGPLGRPWGAPGKFGVHPVDSAGQDVDRWARQLDGGSLATGLERFQEYHAKWSRFDRFL